MPLRGCHEWDREGAPLHNASGVAAFADALRAEIPEATEWIELDAHINDAAFCDKVLEVFDAWFGTSG